jgi:hypothetical protein
MRFARFPDQSPGGTTHRSCTRGPCALSSAAAAASTPNANWGLNPINPRNRHTARSIEPGTIRPPRQTCLDMTLTPCPVRGNKKPGEPARTVRARPMRPPPLPLATRAGSPPSLATLRPQGTSPPRGRGPPRLSACSTSFPPAAARRGRGAAEAALRGIDGQVNSPRRRPRSPSRSTHARALP